VQQLPFEMLPTGCKNDLHQKSWNRAFHQYMQLLAGRCKISGFRFDGVKNPLVQ
jgi:peptidyl-prolyl cis-trans isomerase C